MHDISDLDSITSMSSSSTTSTALNYSNYEVCNKNNKKSYKKMNVKRKPWMSFVNKYSLLTNHQRESLDLFFLSNQVKLTRKNIRSIATELKISYKKIINYIYEENYDHLLVKDGVEERYIHDIKSIKRSLEQTWSVYLEVSKIFKKEMGIKYGYK